MRIDKLFECCICNEPANSMPFLDLQLKHQNNIQLSNLFFCWDCFESIAGKEYLNKLAKQFYNTQRGKEQLSTMPKKERDSLIKELDL